MFLLDAFAETCLDPGERRRRRRRRYDDRTMSNSTMRPRGGEADGSLCHQIAFVTVNWSKRG
jgi:hypothetical protein